MTDTQLKVLQSKILEIVVYFDGFCKDNNITYYLMGGSALGAMRHGGFIPWDDDFDVFMDRVNYIKFLKTAKEKLDTELFYLQEENTEEYPLYFSKIRMNGTTFIEKDIRDRQMHHGIYIDIMCLNNASKNKFIRYSQYFAARVLSARAIAEQGYITKSKSKKLALVVVKYIVNGFVKKGLLKVVRSMNHQKSDYVGHFFGRAPFLKTSFPTDYLGKARYVPFNQLLLPVPEKVEQYLTVRYGEKYMDMPSDAVKEQYPSHAYIVDVDKSYKEYLPQRKEA